MSVTYTENIHLGLQLNKQDYVSWDTITENWRKIDAAVGNISGASFEYIVGTPVPLMRGQEGGSTGIVTEVTT